jgi:hypothetical protein
MTNMKSKAGGETIQSLHREMINNEKLYQKALNNKEQFSVLKGFKNIIKELRSKLEKKAL